VVLISTFWYSSCGRDVDWPSSPTNSHLAPRLRFVLPLVLVVPLGGIAVLVPLPLLPLGAAPLALPLAAVQELSAVLALPLVGIAALCSVTNKDSSGNCSTTLVALVGACFQT
jgi:hypothetical protein